MTTTKKKGTAVYPRTNHDETFDTMGIHNLGDFEALYRRTRKENIKENQTVNEADSGVEEEKVYDEELLREFVNLIFRKEIGAINAVLANTKYSFLPEKIQEMADSVDGSIEEELKGILTCRKEFEEKKKKLELKIQSGEARLTSKKSHLENLEKEYKQWETIRKETAGEQTKKRKEKRDRDQDGGTGNETEKEKFVEEEGGGGENMDVSTLEVLKKRKIEENEKDCNYFKAVDDEAMNEEESSENFMPGSFKNLGNLVNGNEKKQNIINNLDLQQLTSYNPEQLPEQYQLAVSSLHENAFQMKETLYQTLETLSTASQKQAALYHTFKSVQFSSYGSGLVSPMEAIQKELVVPRHQKEEN